MARLRRPCRHLSTRGLSVDCRARFRCQPSALCLVRLGDLIHLQQPEPSKPSALTEDPSTFCRVWKRFRCQIQEIWQEESSERRHVQCQPMPRVRSSLGVQNHYVTCTLSAFVFYRAFRLCGLRWNPLSGAAPAPLSAAGHWALACASCTQPGSRRKPWCRPVFYPLALPRSLQQALFFRLCSRGSF